jgi:hypothetical protein
MILNSTKFGGNLTKDVEVGSDRRADSSIPIYPPNYVCGGYNKSTSIMCINIIQNIKAVAPKLGGDSWTNHVSISGRTNKMTKSNYLSF